MGEARRREAWGRTSAVMALIANVHRDPKKGRGFKPGDFDPFAERGQHAHAEVGIEVLKAVFIDGKVPKEATQ